MEAAAATETVNIFNRKTLKWDNDIFEYVINSLLVCKRSKCKI